MQDEKRILVVDDDPAIGQMLTKALARHRFVVDATTSADAGLERAESSPHAAPPPSAPPSRPSPSPERPPDASR